MSDSPSTEINKSAQNPNGQRDTMRGAATGAFNPPNQDLHSSKNISIDPCSTMGYKSFETSKK